jgi:hypothetical protein
MFVGEIISIYPVMDQIKLYLEILKEHFVGA